MLYIYIYFFSDFSSKIFLGFILLESPNILLSRTNYGVKFNFIGIKKTEGVPKNFLKDRQI